MSSLLAYVTSPYTKFQHLRPWEPSHNQPSKIVVTCFIQDKEKILVLRRGRKDAQYGLWGIPGGKLEPHEAPICGLKRELREELGIEFEQSFQLLDTALSYTSCDGQYGLYLYHCFVAPHMDIRLNPDEHTDYRWVDLDHFLSLKLLTAQREAFYWVETQVRNLIGNHIKSRIRYESKLHDAYGT